MGLAHSPRISTDGLVLALDAGNLKSYPGSGSSWKDLIADKTFNGSDYSSASWANNIEQLTIFAVVEKIGNDPGYASHPINKWNTGTGNASFVLYHFGETGGQGAFYFYYTQGATWTGRYGTILTIGQKAHLAFQWNSVTGSQVWVNGVKVGGRAGSGLLGVSGSGPITAIAPTSNLYTTVHHASFYSRELTDAEVVQHYRAIGKRFGL